MEAAPKRTLRSLRNTRDLRAETLQLATDLLDAKGLGRLTVVDPVVSQETVRKEWDRLLKAIRPDLRSRMALDVETSLEIPPRVDEPSEAFGHFHHLLKDQTPVEGPNYRFEVLRLLLDAQLNGVRPPSIRDLISTIGASQTPIREALAVLKREAIVTSLRGGMRVHVQLLSLELLAKLRALPQTLRFRYERGAMPKPVAALTGTVTELLRARDSNGWMTFALSGVSAAHEDLPGLDLIGAPRLDLTAHLPRSSRQFNGGWLRQVDDALEREPSDLASTPVVVTLIRSDSHFTRNDADIFNGRACPADVFFSLLDIGLRQQAMQYARAVR